MTPDQDFRLELKIPFRILLLNNFQRRKPGRGCQFSREVNPSLLKMDYLQILVLHISELIRPKGVSFSLVGFSAIISGLYIYSFLFQHHSPTMLAPCLAPALPRPYCPPSNLCFSYRVPCIDCMAFANPILNIPQKRIHMIFILFSFMLDP